MIQQTSQIILYIILWLLFTIFMAWIMAKVRVSGDKEFKKFYNEVDNFKQVLKQEYPIIRKILVFLKGVLKCK